MTSDRGYRCLKNELLDVAFQHQMMGTVRELRHEEKARSASTLVFVIEFSLVRGIPSEAIAATERAVLRPWPLSPPTACKVLQNALGDVLCTPGPTVRIMRIPHAVSEALSAIAISRPGDRDTTHLPSCADLPEGSRNWRAFSYYLLSASVHVQNTLKCKPLFDQRSTEASMPANCRTICIAALAAPSGIVIC